MSGAGGGRFRIRTPEGAEVPVASVEALSEQVLAGAVGPDTLLFDSGTGRWSRAGDVPVFQFLVDELRAEGRLEGTAFDDEPELVLPPDPGPVEPLDPGIEFDPIQHEPGEGGTAGGEPGEPGSGGPDGPRPLAPPTVDPFELHLPLGTPDPWQARAEHDPEVVAEPGDIREEGSPREEDDPPEERGAPEEGGPPQGGSAPEPSPESEEGREPWYEDRPFQKVKGEGEPTPESPQAPEESTAPDPVAPDPVAPDPAADDPDASSGPPPDWITHGPRTAAGTPVDGITHGPPPPSRASAPGSSAPPRQPRKPVPPAPAEHEAPAPASDDDFAATFEVPVGARETSLGEPPAEDLLAEETAEPLEIRTAWEDQAEEEDPRVARLAARRRARNARVGVAVAAALIVVAGIAFAVSSRSSQDPASDDAPGAEAATSALPPAAAAPFPEDLALPPGLEVEARALWAELPTRITALVDSLRIETGLAEAPPRPWLGGYYMANAEEFPAVAVFWNTFGAFVDTLQARDEALVRQAVEEVLASRDVPPEDRAPLVALIEGRRASVAAIRQNRYLNLGRTADEALAFHQFLVLNTRSIRYDPALGGGVSDDPVLEAVAGSPALQRELEAHLDRIFAALDRTRAGGQPSPEGLRAELFGNFGVPF
jgi:hypothetical protein